MTQDRSPRTDDAATDEPDTVPDVLADLSVLRERGVPFHVETETAERGAVADLATYDDMAVVGIEDGDGRALLRKATADCAWKLPVETVAANDDYAAAARHALAATGVAGTLDAVEGVWGIDLATPDGEATASRRFVVFRAEPDRTAAEPLRIASGEATVFDADWFAALPAAASALPGTDLFID